MGHVGSECCTWFVELAQWKLRGGIIDRFLSTGSNVFFSVPPYWLAILLILIFAVLNPIFPATGYVPLASDPVGWAQSLILPVLAIALPSAAGLARTTRATVYDALSQEHRVGLSRVSLTRSPTHQATSLPQKH